MGKLKTFQLYDRIKTRTHLPKLNAEGLQKATPRLWARLSEKDEEFAQDLSQAVLVSHLDMIVAVLNFLGIPHEDGFFAKDADVAREERVAASPALGSEPVGLRERVHREPPRTLEPGVVTRAGKRRQKREAVPGGAVAESGALLPAM